MDKKQFKKLLSLTMVLILGLIMAACSQPATSQPAEQTQAAPAAEVTPAPAPAPEVAPAQPATVAEPAATAQEPKVEAIPATVAQPANTTAAKPESNFALKEAIASQPAYLTSAGQSADVQMVKALMEKAKLKYTFNATAKPEDIGGAKTLVLAVGGSSKGLGAAGIEADDEIDRVAALIKKAKGDGMTIIALHIGGEARRGDLSDKFANAVVPSADYVIVVADGNKDGLFTNLTSSKGIPLDTVEKISKALDPLIHAFK